MEYAVATLYLLLSIPLWMAFFLNRDQAALLRDRLRELRGSHYNAAAMLLWVTPNHHEGHTNGIKKDEV